MWDTSCECKTSLYHLLSAVRCRNNLWLWLLGTNLLTCPKRMLAVMTFNVGYFLSVLGGIWLGTFGLGSLAFDDNSIHC